MFICPYREFPYSQTSPMDNSIRDVISLVLCICFQLIASYKKEMQKASLCTQISLPTLALSKSGFGSKRYSFLSADYDQLPVCFYFTQKLRYIQDILYFRCHFISCFLHFKCKDFFRHIHCTNLISFKAALYSSSV